MEIDEFKKLFEGKWVNHENLIQRYATEGWFFSERFDQFQKTKGRVVVYVAPMLWGYTKIQLYRRGPNPSICDMEARHITDRQFLFALGEQWLEDYQDGDIAKINQNPYAINNPEGVWHKDRDLELWWIGGKE